MVELTVAEYLKVGLKRLLAAVFYYFFPWRLFLSRLGRKAIFVVVYHRVLPEDKESILPYISVGPKEFDKHLVFLKNNFRVISMDAAVAFLNKAEELKENFVVITFDDGYLDNFNHAYPVLSRHGLSGTFFVTAGLIGGGKPLWPDAVRSIHYGSQLAPPSSNETKPGHPKCYQFTLRKRIDEVKRDIGCLKGVEEKEKWEWISAAARARGLNLDQLQGFEMMNWDALREMAGHGMIIGSHTVSHPILRNLDIKRLQEEIEYSKNKIEETLGKKIAHFAYPNGARDDLTSLVIETVKKTGYRSAVTTIRGANYPGANPFTLRRTGVYRTDGVREIVLKFCIEKAFGKDK